MADKLEALKHAKDICRQMQEDCSIYHISAVGRIARAEAEAERRGRIAMREEAAQIAYYHATRLQARSNFDQWEAGGASAAVTIERAIRALPDDLP